MSNDLKISIIIPVYNIEKYLSRCIDSILAQEYKNLEIIAVDDGSKDTSGKILDEYAVRDGRIKVIHKENGGVSTARLAGVKAATGDYIGFVDGDDYIEPDMFKRLVGNAIKFNADISHCGYVMDFPNRCDYYYNTGRVVEQDTQKGLYDLLKCVFVEPGLVNKIYKKSIVKSMVDSGVMDDTIKTNEDLLMNYYLFKRSEKSVFEDICPYHYIVRRGSAANSGVSVHKLLDPIKVRKAILDDLEKDDGVYPVVAEDYLRAIIRATHQKKLIRSIGIDICGILKNELKIIGRTPGFSKKVLYMAWLAAYLPFVYMIVRRVYDKASGNDKKYSLE